MAEAAVLHSAACCICSCQGTATFSAVQWAALARAPKEEQKGNEKQAIRLRGRSLVVREKDRGQTRLLTSASQRNPTAPNPGMWISKISLRCTAAASVLIGVSMNTTKSVLS